MQKFQHFNYLARSRWPLIALTGGVVVAATTGFLRLQAEIRAQLPGILQARLESALHRKVQIGTVHLTPLGVSVEGVHVFRAAADREDPLVAKRLYVGVDWWRLVRDRQWQVSGVEAVDAQIRLTQGGAGNGSQPWTQQFLALSSSGIERFRVRNASLGLLPAAGPELWSASGVTGELVPGAREFRYAAQLKQLRTPEVQLASLRLSGTGDEKGVTLKEGVARYQGARVRARGQLRAARNEALVTLQVDHLPLGRLAARLGIPAEWAMQGSVTGEVTVDARDNALRAVKGNVEIARGSLAGSGGELSWNSAHARVDWNPSRTRLSQVRVLGNGVTLTADGDVTVRPGEAFTAGQFQVSGELSASDPQAVTQVADLLAFRQLLEGRWKASNAVVRFHSQGRVNQLAQAVSTGHVHVDGLTFRPLAGSEPVTVQHLDANLERSGARLAFNRVKAQTGGMTVSGEVRLASERPGEPAEFVASGDVEVADLTSLRKAVPEASLWKWVPELSPAANGRLRVSLGGPVGHPDELWSEGHFEVHDLRLGAHTPLPNGNLLSVPVQVARGDFRHAHRRLEVKNLALLAPGFEGAGQLEVNFAGAHPALDSELNVRSTNWRELLAVSPEVLPQVQGGDLTGGLHVTGRLDALAESQVTGDLQLHGASYAPVGTAVEPVPVRELAATFRWAGGASAPERRLELSEVRLDTELLQATASGTVRPTDGDYELALEVEAKTDHAGKLAGQLQSPLKLAEGSAVARVSVNGSLRHLGAAAVEGTASLEGVTLLHPVQPLGLASLEVRHLETAFSHRSGAWQVRDLRLDTPELQATVSGDLTGSAIDANVQVKADRWKAPEALPFAGGTVELAGRLTGDLQAAQSLQFQGDLQLQGAQAAYRTGKVALTGGTVRASLHGEGTLSEPARWVRGGTVALEHAVWSGAGVKSLEIQHAAAKFDQDAGQFRFTDVALDAGSAHLKASGRWSEQGHTAEITASARDLAAFGIALPEALQVGNVGITASLRGSRAKPFETASGRLELQDVRLAATGMPAQSLEKVTSQFRFDGERLQLEGLTGSGTVGTLTGAGWWSPSAYRVTAEVAGTEFARLGYSLPEGVHLGGYGLRLELSGAGKERVAATGRLHLNDARFHFGPGAPHHLERIETALRLDGKRVILSDLSAEGETGVFTGSGEVAGGRFRLTLHSPRTNPDLVRWLVPGSLQGGTLAGTLVLEGAASGQLQTAGGHLEFRDGAYAAPDTMGLLGGSFPVARIGADYHWERHGEKGRTSLTDLQVETALGNGTGTLTAADGSGTLVADLVSGDTGRVADRWPMLNAHLRGGTGTGQLQMRFDATGSRGTLAVKAQGGTLLLPGELPEYAQQPVTTMSGVLGFEPGKLTFNDVKVRGPKANVDGSGAWVDGGEVTGSGKAWFSKSYTAKLLKPTGFGWLAKLFGLKEIKSDFTLSGTSDQVKLNAGITRGLLWKVAKSRVPKEFQKIATGKSPLWVKPLVVAEAQPIPAGANLTPAQPQAGGD